MKLFHVGDQMKQNTYFRKLIKFSRKQNNKNILAFFNRLSIIDLSHQASQPMVSDEYKNLILFNGEIYNHRQLRIDMSLME